MKSVDQAGLSAEGLQAIDNPALVLDSSRHVRGIAYGQTINRDSLMEHKVGFAYAQYKIEVLSCPDVTHMYTRGQYFSRAIQLTFKYDQYCQVRVRDPLTNVLLASWKGNAARGAVFKYVP
jgi:hypothetical protein